MNKDPVRSLLAALAFLAVPAFAATPATSPRVSLQAISKVKSYASRCVVMVISAFRRREIGHPAFAFAAAVSKAC